MDRDWEREFIKVLKNISEQLPRENDECTTVVANTGKVGRVIFFGVDGKVSDRIRTELCRTVFPLVYEKGLEPIISNFVLTKTQLDRKLEGWNEHCEVSGLGT